MATVAAMLRRKGHEVRGSDENVYPPMSDFLEREGIAVLSGYRAEHVTGDIGSVIAKNPSIKDGIASDDDPKANDTTFPFLGAPH